MFRGLEFPHIYINTQFCTHNMARLSPIKSREQVREEFRRKGVSIREWATANEFSPTLVYNILSAKSRLSCDYGQSHQIAVRLGLKQGEITPSARNAF